jgi:6-phosphogluconolactonase
VLHGLLVFAPLSLLTPAASRAADVATWVFVGTHGASPPGAPAAPAASAASAAPAPGGEKHGIYTMHLDPMSGQLTSPQLAIELQRSTWVVSHPKLPVIYAVAAGSGSQVNSDLYALRFDSATGGLAILNKVDSGGRDATALALDASSATLFAAHYGSGSLSAVPILPDGALGAVASAQTESGSGPHPRQKSAHAHDVAVAPGGHAALVTDLGADRVFIYHFDPATRALSPAKYASETVPAGSGPRHLAFVPGGKVVLVNTELSAELRSYRWESTAEKLTPEQTIDAFPQGGAGERSGGELTVSKDGRYAYISLRGDQDSIVVYAVNAARGTLTEIERIPSQGKTPWSFGIDPSGHWMLITNEGSSSVAVLKVDPATGLLSTTGISVAVPKPVTVSFYAR